MEFSSPFCSSQTIREHPSNGRYSNTPRFGFWKSPSKPKQSQFNMPYKLLDHTSIIVDSVVMCLLSCWLITLTALAPYGHLYVRSTSIQLPTLVVVLTIIACAYGIPISKVRKGYSSRFAITASVFAVLSIVISVINSVVERVGQTKGVKASSFEAGYLNYDIEANGSSPGALHYITEVVVYVAAILMAVKYIRTCVMLSKEHQSMMITGHVVQPPNVMAVQGSFYPVQPAVQPMMVGPPIYQPS